MCAGCQKCSPGGQPVIEVISQTRGRKLRNIHGLLFACLFVFVDELTSQISHFGHFLEIATLFYDVVNQGRVDLGADIDHEKF